MPKQPVRYYLPVKFHTPKLGTKLSVEPLPFNQQPLKQPLWSLMEMQIQLVSTIQQGKILPAVKSVDYTTVWVYSFHI